MVLGAQASGKDSYQVPQHQGISTLTTAIEAVHRNGTVDVNPEGLPLKGDQKADFRPSHKMGYCARRAARRQLGEIDEELTQYLQFQALYKPRTAELLAFLKNKAEQFLKGYNTYELTWAWRLETVGKAVGQAMDILPVERIVRQHLKNPVQNEERQKQANLLQSGVAGRTGAITKVTHVLPTLAH